MIDTIIAAITCAATLAILYLAWRAHRNRNKSDG